MSDNDEFENNVAQTGEGQGATYSVPVSTLRKNGHVVIDGRPCRLLQVSTTTEGSDLVAEDLFTDQEIEASLPSDATVNVPTVSRKDYQLVNVDDDEGMLNLQDIEGTPRDDIRIPNGTLGDQIKADFADGKDLVVMILSAMGESKPISVREATKAE
ncbi:eukaryotic translation initiation factor 5A [Penicillium brevicompactum]|uniref:Eukaryotic translation initiation factor 5A n=1 Tax=Penicillium brevicompactum TaxID=5074 RepID=A0A9W9RVH7_PENBR|nr:eukaryotic translation initiation factor 5A [Penicillium brevicompactum]